MRDTNPMDSALRGQQQIFAPPPSLQVSRARCSCLCPGFGPVVWRAGSSAAVGRRSHVLRVTYSTGSFLLHCCWRNSVSVGWWCRVAAGGRRGLHHESSALPWAEYPARTAGVTAEGLPRCTGTSAGCLKCFVRLLCPSGSDNSSVSLCPPLCCRWMM